MIYPNKPARKYEFYSELSDILTRTDIAFADSVAMITTLTWGNAFSATHGIQITEHAWWATADAAGHNEVILDGPNPWSIDTTSTGTGIPSDIKSRLTVFDATLTVDASCNWSFTFSSMTWEVDLGSGYSTLLTIAGRTDTGSGYDGRLNIWKGQAQATSNLAPPGLPDSPACAASYAAETTFGLDAEASGLLDWRYDAGAGWVYPDFALLSQSVPGVSTLPGCTDTECRTSLPSIVVGTIYPRISLFSEVILGKTKHDEGRITCHCPPGTTELRPGIFDVWTVTTDYINQQCTVGALPKDAGITNSTKEEAARCWCIDPPPAYTLTSSTSVDPYTYLETSPYVVHIVSRSTCFTVVQLGICALPADGGSVSVSSPDCFSGDYSCGYEAYTTLVHPDFPPCPSEGGTYPSYDVGQGLRHYRAFLKSGNAWTGFADNNFASGWQNFDTGMTADSVCIRVDRRSVGQPLYLWIEDAGSITRYTSSDEGQTWGSSLAIATGTKPTANIGQNGFKYTYWIDGGNAKGEIRDANDNIVVAAFTAVAGVDDAGLASDEVVGVGGVHGIFLFVVIGGVVKRYYAPEGKTFGGAVTIATGTKPAAIVGLNGIRYEYFLDGGDAKGELRDGNDNVLVSTFTAVVGVDDAGVAIDESVMDGGVHRIIMLVVYGGVLSQFQAVDGVNFV